MWNSGFRIASVSSHGSPALQMRHFFSQRTDDHSKTLMCLERTTAPIQRSLSIQIFRGTVTRNPRADCQSFGGRSNCISVSTWNRMTFLERSTRWQGERVVHVVTDRVRLLTVKRKSSRPIRSTHKHLKEMLQAVLVRTPDSRSLLRSLLLEDASSQYLSIHCSAILCRRRCRK